MIENKVDRKAIIRGVRTVKELHSKWLDKETIKKPLLDDLDDTPLFLQVTLKKLPPNSTLKIIKIPLPHSLITDTTEVCLITGDLNKKDKKEDIEPTVEHYKDLLRKHDIKSISEVIPLRQLRTDYKAFEAKRQLLGAYHVFLADNKIYQCLQKALGKFFFKKRKFPHGIDVHSLNLKNQIEKALSNTVLYLTGHGNSCSIEISRLGLPEKKTAANIMAAIQVLEKSIPGSWANINGLFVKTPRSKALPIYMSFESRNDIVFEPKPLLEKIEPEEISTLKKTKVKIFPDGQIHLVKCKKEEESDSDDDYEDKLLAEVKRNNRKRKRYFKDRTRSKLKKKLKTDSKKGVSNSLKKEKLIIKHSIKKEKLKTKHTIKKEKNIEPTMESKPQIDNILTKELKVTKEKATSKRRNSGKMSLTGVKKNVSNSKIMKKSKTPKQKKLVKLA